MLPHNLEYEIKYKYRFIYFDYCFSVFFRVPLRSIILLLQKAGVMQQLEVKILPQ